MSNPWLLLDVSYLAWRSYYAFGNLSYNQIPTTVVFGVLREIMALREQFSTSRTAFCFDVGKPWRSLDCPEYKSGREEDENRRAVREQLTKLRKDYLPSLGFQNILWQKGYEADDVIAKVIEDRPKRTFIVVSADQDLFQLLRGERVLIWNPHKKIRWTQKSFEETYGISPDLWADVKAIAGCSSDNIAGVRGIGEKTAIKFLSGRLAENSAAFKKIVKGNKQWQRNLGLVRLPYPGMKPFTLKKDKTTPEKWKALIDRLGMKSLAKDIPGLPRQRKGFSRKELRNG